MKREIIHLIANELRDTIDDQIRGLMSAEKDKAYGLSDLVDEATNIIDTILAKYKDALSIEDYDFLENMSLALDELANDYDTSNDEIEVDVEPIQPSQDLPKSNDKVIDVEIVK